MYRVLTFTCCFYGQSSLWFFFQGNFSAGWVSWRHTGKVQGRGQTMQPGLLGKIRPGGCRACLNIRCHSAALLSTHASFWPVPNPTSVRVRRQQRYMDVLLSFLISTLWLNTKRAKIFFSVLKHCQEKFEVYILINQSFKLALNGFSMSVLYRGSQIHSLDLDARAGCHTYVARTGIVTANVPWGWWSCFSLHTDFQPLVLYNLSFERQQRGYPLRV